MPPSALLFIVCQALANQGPLDVNGWPADGVKLNQGSCRNEIVEMLDQADPERISSAADFSNPTVCVRMAMSETAHWQEMHPGWYVQRVKCPHPDGTFPGDTPV